MPAIQTQIFSPGRIGLHKQDTLLDARIEQFASRLAGEPTTETIFRIDRITYKIKETTNCTPGPVAINIIQELQELRIKYIYSWGSIRCRILRRRVGSILESRHSARIATERRRHLCNPNAWHRKSACIAGCSTWNKRHELVGAANK